LLSSSDERSVGDRRPQVFAMAFDVGVISGYLITSLMIGR
jgi:hypothetical protein